MTSRLDRLFILLESSSSAVTRRAAAKQIGEVQKLHPHELHNLLNRLKIYLNSSSWDTRIAAAQAVEAILNYVPQWNPTPIKNDLEAIVDNLKNDATCSAKYDTGLLKFSNFDLSMVLEKGARLMGSEGTEFDIQENELNCDDRERLLKQHELLNKKLGLNKGNTKLVGLNINELVTLEDVKANAEGNYDPNIRLMPVQNILKQNDLTLSPPNNSSRFTSSTTPTACSSPALPSSPPTSLIPSSSTYTLTISSNSITATTSMQTISSPFSLLSSSRTIENSTDINSSQMSLSCREMNRARRKNRQIGNGSNNHGQSGTGSNASVVGITGNGITGNCNDNNTIISTHLNSMNSINNDISTSQSSCHQSVSIETNSLLATTTSSSVIPPINITISLLDENIEPDKKRIKIEHRIEINDPVPDGTGAWGTDAVSWPLESFCSKLYLDLFNPRWETRHGAATALRELIKKQSAGAGKQITMTEQQMNEHHLLWLEDAALRLLCILALDRFGDFISDQVVAPVRETCAQVLGAIMKEMSLFNVEKIVVILLGLIKQNEWEVRHGGLLGIKYMLVVREDLLQTFLPMTINDILRGLFDQVDDVGAVAASTLIPISSWLPKLLNSTQVSNIVKMLWDLLLDQDELTSACNSFMGLLAAILSLNESGKWIQMEPMSVLVPRLWPFLSHSTSSVRRSTLQTLKTLTKVQQCDSSRNSLNQNVVMWTNAQTNSTNTISSSSSPDDIQVNENGILELSKKLNNNANNLKYNFGVKEWSANLLQEALRHIYQRVLIEHIEDIQNLLEDVWYNLVANAELSALLHAACPYVAAWMCLAMQPARLPFDSNLMIFAKQQQPNRERKSKLPDLVDAVGSIKLLPKMYLGGIETTSIDVREKNIPRARCKASKMLGLLSRYLVMPAPGVIYSPNIESPIDCYVKLLMGYLSSRSALQRLISGMVISFWALYDGRVKPGPILLQERLICGLNECIFYDECAMAITRLQQESRDFISTLKQYKIPMAEFDTIKLLTFDQIQMVCNAMTIDMLKSKYIHLKPKTLDLIEERRRSLFNSYTQTQYDHTCINVTTQTILAGATVSMECLPEKLNPVIKPLMESIKREECEIFQQLSAKFLVNLLNLVIDRQPSPISKIITNLCTLLRSDEDFTPKIIITDNHFKDIDSNDTHKNPYYGILTLANQMKTNENSLSSVRGPGRPPTVEVTNEENVIEAEDPLRKFNRIQRIGSTYAIKEICEYFGKDLNGKIQVIWNLMVVHIQSVVNQLDIEQFNEHIFNLEKANELMICLQLIEIASPSVHSTLHPELFEILDILAILLCHPFKAIRHMTSRCLATLSLINASKVMDVVMEKIIPLLQTIESNIKRQGAIEAIACIVNKLQFHIVPYVILLVVPLLGRMSDSDRSVRLISTHCFATLIQLMPLDSGDGNDTNKNNACDKQQDTDEKTQLSMSLQLRKIKDREFLDYLFTPKKIPEFKLPIPINVELRSYQQAGINWLWFLNKYKLHGILCDDMGLGKTLQAICVLAGDHHERNEQKLSSIPSLVVCPPTLTGHWIYEVQKFLSEHYLRPLHYIGLPIDRERLRSKVFTHNLIVASYDIVRKDIDFFGSINWNYIILDEGHIIKNGKTKSSKAIKTLVANHRLILSGTPIQNNVLELWSLFDFLMPGFLGTEKQFMHKFSRPILASRDPKSSSKEQEAGALAMETLHRQVLPFLLRRMKEDVLTDLPPKITQDLLCELSPLQERLYEDFSRTHLRSNIKDCLENVGDGQPITKTTHVFQALRYLQNVCNHPKLVLNKHHPEYNRIQADLANLKTSLDDIEHSAKLPVLRQLLLDCGIGVVVSDDSITSSVNQHRALIFCQLKTMLDIIENDLFKKHLPAVSYLRLDGGVPSSQRHLIVTKFNSDPSIDVLLLTTQVGGLGLNLTGADTVIFVEHDWNPMKDLQAMDRAHRIGQKKIVNVYRLITRRSLEEKIMGLQKFKILTANTVVSDENASMETMATEQLLDLFTIGSGDMTKGNNSKSNSQLNNNKQRNTLATGGEDAVSGNIQGIDKIMYATNTNNVMETVTAPATMKHILENLPDLWEDKQYDEEYDLTQFLKSLK